MEEERDAYPVTRRAIASGEDFILAQPRWLVIVVILLISVACGVLCSIYLLGFVDDALDVPLRAAGSENEATDVTDCNGGNFENESLKEKIMHLETRISFSCNDYFHLREMMRLWRTRDRDKRFEWFIKNGSTFLKELIADCNGTSNPICIFSSDQILKATNNFDPSGYISRHRFFAWHKGIIQDRCYLIKRYKEEYLLGEYEPVVYNDIVISARVSNHKSFLKLLGCCLEFPLPVLVFEYAENGALNDQGGVGSENRQLLPWNVRLKITKEVANAVTYLHTAFPRIIIHREIKPTNVFLDKNWKAKLSDFAFSISLPEGKSWIKDKVMGTIGYIDPSYFARGIVTEYTHVFSFGIFLLVLLSGRPAIFPGSPDNIHDYVKGLHDKGDFFELTDEFGKKSMYAFLELALRCCEMRQEERPKMIEVAKEIKLIERSLDVT